MCWCQSSSAGEGDSIRQMLLVNPVRKSVMEETAGAPGGLTKLEERTGGLYLDLFFTSLKVQLLEGY